MYVMPVCSARARRCTDRAHRAAHRSTSTENQVHDAQRLTRVRRFLRVCVGCVLTSSYCIRHIKCIICISYGMLQLVPWRYAPVVPPVDRVMSHPPVRVQHSTKVVRTSGVCVCHTPCRVGGRGNQFISVCRCNVMWIVVMPLGRPGSSAPRPELLRSMPRRSSTTLHGLQHRFAPSRQPIRAVTL